MADESFDLDFGNESDKAAGSVSDSAVAQNYAVDFGTLIPDLDSPFAKAFGATLRKGRADGPLYALLFQRRFPLSFASLKTYKKIDTDALPKLIDHGVVAVEGAASEQHAVVFTQPLGRRLEEFLGKEPFPERFVLSKILKPISDVLSALHSQGLMHGNINPANIFYDPDSEVISLGPPLIEYTGFSQPPYFEPVHRATSHPAGKGGKDPGADYYALGVLVVLMISGKLPPDSPDGQLAEKLEAGTYPVVTGTTKMTYATQELIRGLLNDNPAVRWGAVEISNWISRKKNESIPLTTPKEAMYPFAFHGKEYFSRKSLAHALHGAWAQAKLSVKISDLARWLRNNVMKPDLAKRVEELLGANKKEPLMLDDDQVSRIISILDPEGPIRLQDTAIAVDGISAYLSYGYLEARRELIQHVGDLFNRGLVEYWIGLQLKAEDYTQTYLGWSPGNITRCIRRGTLGFGMERCLYDMNPTLACQSPLTGSRLIRQLEELLLYLDKIPEEVRAIQDPVDRHVGAFIANRISLPEEVRIKGLASFPEIARHPHVIMLSLLALAQAQIKMRPLKNLAVWMKTRLEGLISSLHSESLRMEMQRGMEKAAADGNLTNLFHYVTDASIYRRDQFGYKEAIAQYHNLAIQIGQAERQENIESKAYEYGLRVSLVLAYLTCVMTVFAMVAMAP